MILIVDDKQENLFSLKTVLEQHGFETDTVASGEEALKKVLRKEYALIILDVQMPVMDGFEVAEAITGLNKTKDIPIIFLSAVNTHKRFVTKGFESGAVEYLTKPVDTDILILKVRNFYRLYEKTHALREAEKKLTATVSELHTILESLPQLAFTANSEGVIEMVNHQWLQFASSGKEFPQTAEGSTPLQKSWNIWIAKGLPIEEEVLIRKNEDGCFYYHLLRATPVRVNGNIVRWVGNFSNIHQQKTLNETLEAKVAERTRELMEINRKLELTNNDLQQFTSVASHDLKEPLRKIQFFGNLILDEGGLEGKNANYLSKIIQSSGRMSQLISDLLSFARLSETEIFQPTDINTLIDTILLDLELLMAEKKAEITTDPVPQLEVAPSLMHQLLLNVISNALKFSRPGVPPRIHISSETVLLPVLHEENGPLREYCRIAIADNGIGFDEKFKSKIFTLFQRLNAREEYEGTGIGLTIAQKIIDKHKGNITAQSRPNEGATFFITLPLRQEAALHADLQRAPVNTEEP